MLIGSLCTGSGMLDHVVAETFKADIAWAVENDWVAAHVASNALGLPGDDGGNTDGMFVESIADINWETWPLETDIITAGWPCQPFSRAGRRKGADDHRAIWPEVGRAIRALRPRWLVLENVSDIIRSGEFTRVATDLAGLGYDIRWTCLRAAEAGAPHRRERIFILGCHEGFPESPRVTAPLIPPVKPIKTLLPTPCASDGDRNALLQTRTDARVINALADPQWMLDAKPALSRWRNILRRKPPTPMEHTDTGNLKVNVRFVEWMMGFPDGWVTDCPMPAGGWVPGRGQRWNHDPRIPDTYALRILGNAVVPQQVKLALGRLFDYRQEARVYGID